MLGVTIFGIFFTPVLYVVVRWFTERPAASKAMALKSEEAHEAALAAAGTEPHGDTRITSK
jgi:hypothetical protein